MNQISKIIVAVIVMAVVVGGGIYFLRGNETILTVSNFEKIRNYLAANDKNTNRKIMKIADFDVENFGNTAPFDRFSIEGPINGKKYKFMFSIQDENTLNIFVLRNNGADDLDHLYSEELMTSDEKQAAQDMVSLVIAEIKK